MKKTAQSLIDFINLLPNCPIQVLRGSPVSNKEAATLYDIWQNKRDEYGNYAVPDSCDSMVIASLTTKGMIRNKQFSRVGSGSSPVRFVEITDKGKNIIKNIILSSEKSSFENKTDQEFQFDILHRAASVKTASKVDIESNWLTRTFK